MSEVLRLSNSEMAEFRRCRRKWYWSTYRSLGPRRDTEPGTAPWIGNVVHDALAFYYDPETTGDPVAFATAQMEDLIKQFPVDEDLIWKEFDLPRIMLEGYLEWLEETGADGDMEIQGSERMIEVNLVEGVNLLSKIDAPVRRESDGALLAFEHKTVGSLNDPLIGLKIDGQLLTEHLARFLDEIEKGATHEEAYARCQGILYNMLRKVKRTASANPPFYGREDVLHNIHELRNHWRHVMAIARQIQQTRERLDAGEDMHTACPPTPMPDRCKWDCPFFKVCNMADDGSDIEGALSAMFVIRDPLSRYANAETL